MNAHNKTSIFKINNLNKTYKNSDVAANNNLSFEILPGEVFGILGANGSGKTTLIKQMVNLIMPTSGEIQFNGKPLDELKHDLLLQIGYMPQDGMAFNNLTVGEALFFTAFLRGLSKREASKERDRIISLFDIQSLRNRYARKLSGGQKRLLQIATALVGEPPVVILDEPTNDLDPQRRQQVWEVLKVINQKGTTIIFITHDAIEAEKIIQRVAIMEKGNIIAMGSPSELKEKLGYQFRLELIFDPVKSPKIPKDIFQREINPGHKMLYIQRDQLTQIMELLNLSQYKDFHLYKTTLEDLYFYYAKQNS